MQNSQERTDVSNRTFYRLHIFIKHALSEFPYFEEEKTNKCNNYMFIINFYPNMFRA